MTAVFLSAVVNEGDVFDVRISQKALVNTIPLLIMAALFYQIFLNRNAYDFFP
jgi:hypothetical protein